MNIRHAPISLKKSHALITIPNQEQGERDENLPDVRGPGGRDAALVPPVQRAAAYDKIAQAVAKDRPIIYLYHRNWLWAHTAKLTGLRTVPDGLVRVQGLQMK